MVLVTGGTGFIGERLVSRLINKGVGFRLLSRRCVPRCETVISDLQSQSIPLESFNDVSTVFHLAALVGDYRNAKDIDQIYRSFNIDLTVRLAELAADFGAKRFVYVSSVRAAGRPMKGKCMTECDVGEPEAAYGKTKREAEIKLLDISRRTGLKVTIIRPALVYGIGVRGNLKKFIAAVIDDCLPKMFETENRLSMINVEDLVSALLLVAKEERASGEIYIATDGVDYTTRKIFNAIENTLARQPSKLAYPKSFFYLRALLEDLAGGRASFDSYYYHKLFNDEWYSSCKLQGIGFKPKSTLYDTLPDIISHIKG